MFRSRSALAIALLLAACTANSAEVRPRQQDVYFPTGAALSGDERYLFVTNANSELRYDSGSVSVIDLAEVDARAAEWVSAGTVPAGCAGDLDHRETLDCDDEPIDGKPAPPPFVMAEAGVRIGNFASALAVQHLDDGNERLIIAVRGDPSITWADWDGNHLSCSGDAAFPLCDDVHRLNHLDGAPDLGIPDEPFEVFVDSTAGFSMVTHLTTGSVTLIDTPSDRSTDPRITDVAAGLFDSDPTGATGAAGVAGRTPDGTGGDIVYVTSRTEDRVQMVTVQPDADGAFMVPSNFFFLDGVGGNSGGSSDTRYAAFSTVAGDPTTAGDRLMLVNRSPPSLQVYDTSLDTGGFPKNRFLAATDLCREASNMAVADVGDGSRAYISCFRDGEVYVIDPEPRPEVESIVTVGRGPFGLVASAVRKKLYVTNFLDDTIAVVELDPLSPLRYEVVLRIGVAR